MRQHERPTARYQDKERESEAMYKTEKTAKTGRNIAAGCPPFRA